MNRKDRKELKRLAKCGIYMWNVTKWRTELRIE